MSVFRFRNSKVYWIDFYFQGQRIQESTRTRSKTLAKKIETKRRRELEEGAAGIRKREQPRLLSVASQEWIELKKLSWAKKTQVIQQNSFNHLLPRLGKKLLVDIDARDISQYQKARIAEGAAHRTVNIELGTLRQVMRKYGAWARIQHDVQMLSEREDAGQALSAEEESELLMECGRSRSRMLLPFVVLALETGARYNTVRTLQWGNIDFASRCLRFGKDKTASGTGRTVPLNQRAMDTLQFWAQQFPSRRPEHYVFPAEKVGAAGHVFDAKVYGTDPNRPIAEIKTAWRAAKRRTQRHCPHCGIGTLADKPKPEKGFVCVDCSAGVNELPPGLISVRFHDLRHSAVTRMIAGRVPLPKIAKVVGWSAGTMAKMAARYGHFGVEDLRDAVETISSTHKKKCVLDRGSLDYSLESQSPREIQRGN